MKFSLPPLRVKQADSAFAAGNSRFTNFDLDPIPRDRRRWGVISFIAYWGSDALNAATWQFASSILAVGLTYKEALEIVAISFFTVSIVISLNGAIGVLYHAPFPVLARASWGFYGSYIAIVSRWVLAVFWFAIQTMNGANAVKVMIGAIWPSFLTLHNSIPVSQGITTNSMISFFIFWLAQVPFLVISPDKLRWLFIAKSIIVPIAWIAMLIWAFTSTDGGDIFDQRPKAHGSAYSWAWISSYTAVIGNYATLSVNQADFSRYSKVSVKWQMLYTPFLPCLFTFISFIGISCTSAGAAKYGTLQWDPMALVSEWDNRACRFFAGFSFALASLGVNISANSLSAANDLMALFPRYINLKRGQVVCALISWALVPWKILESAGSFLNFMSAYSIFLGPIAAILCLDFWIIHERKYDVLALYQYDNIYHYWHGANWRAIVAFLVGIAPSMPGLIHSVNKNIDAWVGNRPYDFGWLLGFFSTGLVYCVLMYAFRPEETFIKRAILPDEIYDAQVATIEGESREDEELQNENDSGEKRDWKTRLYNMI